MLKRLFFLRVLQEDPRRRLTFTGACGVATLAVAQLIAPPITRSAAPTTFAATFDAYVSERSPQAPHGGLDYLRVDGGPRARSTYLRFDLPAGRRAMTRATLRVYSLLENPDGVAVRFVADDTWTEHGITFANAPALGRVVGHSAAIAGRGWIEIDVTQALLRNPAIAAGGSLELALSASRRPGAGEAASEFASRETGRAPQLSVATDGVTPPASTTTTATSSTSTSAPPATSAPASTTSPPAAPRPTVPRPRSTPAPEGGFYVDSAGGNDANPGTSPGAPWRSLARVGAAALGPGDHVHLRRGARWNGESLVVGQSGSGTDPIVIGAYGTGPLPLIQGGNCVELRGNAIVLREVQVDGCAWAGVSIYGAGDRVELSMITHNVTGVFARPGSNGAVITANDIRDNNRMSVLTPGGDDDSGAFGVLLQGAGTEVSFNTIAGHDAFSYDYGRDGAAVEVYGATGSHVHHNLALDNDAFTELGKSSSADNTFAYNVVRGSTPNGIGVVTRGAGSGYGPVRNTRLFNNVIVLTGGNSQGFVCHGGCGPSILVMRNNIVQAVAKAGYADAPFDEAHNLYFGGKTQFAMGPNSFVADPWFADAGAGNLHLRPGSPAVNRGVGVGYTYDADRRTVPLGGAPDLGAYELA